MVRARHKISGVVRDVPENIVDHVVLGANYELVDTSVDPDCKPCAKQAAAEMEAEEVELDFDAFNIDDEDEE